MDSIRECVRSQYRRLLLLALLERKNRCPALARVLPPGQNSQDKAHGLSTRQVNRRPFYTKVVALSKEKRVGTFL